MTSPRRAGPQPADRRTLSADLAHEWAFNVNAIMDRRDFQELAHHQCDVDHVELACRLATGELDSVRCKDPNAGAALWTALSAHPAFTARYLMSCGRLFNHYAKLYTRWFGGTVKTDRRQVMDDGRVVETTTVHRYAPMRLRLLPGRRHTSAARMPRARTRGAGRPAASSTRSSARSGDSPDSDSDPEPPHP